MMSLDREVFDFPTVIPLKVIGRNEQDFEAFVVSLFQKHLDEEDIQKVESRLSREDRYLSVTVSFTASSRVQLNAIYAELQSQQRVLMVI
ncbi:DUF493 domain-containing protein [Anaerolinea sp.]|uniref:YbeD family protein n=1 Tax=Anaerolinea sp. TaxID=1872519 RepID=UPI002ACEE33B|nr:DUF493 domain-containing protein [Anaerolinea sp.]